MRTENSVYDLIANHLGFVDNKDMESRIGIKIHGRPSWGQIQFHYTEPFYIAMTRSATVNDMYYIFNTDTDITDEDKKTLTTRFKGMVRKQSKLETLKSDALVEIKHYIAKVFRVDPKLIPDEDIVFKAYKNFHFIKDDIVFSYSSTLTDMDLSVDGYMCVNREVFTDTLDRIRTHYGYPPLEMFINN